MQDDGGVGEMIYSKEWEGSRLRGNDVGVCYNSECCVIKEAGGGLVHSCGFMLHVTAGKVLACKNKWPMEWGLRRWRIIVGMGPMRADRVEGGVLRIGRVVCRRVSSRVMAGSSNCGCRQGGGAPMVACNGCPGSLGSRNTMFMVKGRMGAGGEEAL